MKALNMLTTRLEKLSTHFHKATTHSLSQVICVTYGSGTHNSYVCLTTTPAQEEVKARLNHYYANKKSHNIFHSVSLINLHNPPLAHRCNNLHHRRKNG